MLASQLSDHARAKEAAEEGLRISKEAGIEDGRRPFFVWNSPTTFFLNRLAMVSMEQGDHERARALG